MSFYLSRVAGEVLLSISCDLSMWAQSKMELKSIKFTFLKSATAENIKHVCPFLSFEWSCSNWGSWDEFVLDQWNNYSYRSQWEITGMFFFLPLCKYDIISSWYDLTPMVSENTGKPEIANLLSFFFLETATIWWKWHNLDFSKLHHLGRFYPYCMKNVWVVQNLKLKHTNVLCLLRVRL